MSRVGQYDFPSLSEDSDSSPEQVQALVQQGGEGEEEEEQDNKMENRVSLTSSILKQVKFNLTLSLSLSLSFSFSFSLSLAQAHTHSDGSRYGSMGSMDPPFLARLAINLVLKSTEYGLNGTPLPF